jgi:hypothetical protein
MIFIGKVMRVIPKSLTSVEKIALALTAVALLIKIALGLRLYYPDHNALRFLGIHYAAPVAITLIISLFLLAKRKSTNEELLGETWNYLRTGLAFAWIVFVHFNLKLWSHLINPRSWDQLFNEIDHHLPMIFEVAYPIATTVQRYWSFSNSYSDLFILMFVISFVYHGLRGGYNEFETVVVTCALVLALGGIAYSFAPAFGPLMYEDPPFRYMTAMKSFTVRFIESHGIDYDPEMFAAMLAAMPSLHVAHATVFTWFAFRFRREMLAIFIPVLLYICSGALATRFHYVIDLPAGFLVAFICIRISQTLESRSRNVPG